nr:winged helix-turn-helix domain-containing protein [Nocardioides convexus]
MRALRPRRDAPVSASLTTAAGGEVLRFEGLTIDLAAREVTLSGEPVALTRTEYDLLATLAASPRRVFARRQLVDAVWGEGWGGDEHIVDVHVAHLRNKIGDDATEPRYVETVRGVGYRFKPESIR